MPFAVTENKTCRQPAQKIELHIPVKSYGVNKKPVVKITFGQFGNWKPSYTVTASLTWPVDGANEWSCDMSRKEIRAYLKIVQSGPGVVIHYNPETGNRVAFDFKERRSKISLAGQETAWVSFEKIDLIGVSQ
ncbi:MAG: hypothetical protein ACEQSB_00190 [Undibacterium sp.]